MKLGMNTDDQKYISIVSNLLQITNHGIQRWETKYVPILCTLNKKKL